MILIGSVRANQRVWLLRFTRDSASAGPILASTSRLLVMGREACGKYCDPAEQSDNCHQK
jgi:hypothetical protein